MSCVRSILRYSRDQWWILSLEVNICGSRVRILVVRQNRPKSTCGGISRPVGLVGPQPPVVVSKYDCYALCAVNSEVFARSMVDSEIRGEHLRLARAHPRCTPK